MTHLDPEERSNDSSGDSVEDTDLAFARIVAGLRAQGLPEHPDATDARDPDEDHFDPPEPPPLPIPRPRTVGGVATLALGVLLLAAPNLVGLGDRLATPLGLLAVTAGIGWLVIGLRSDPPPAGPDDGARV